MEIKDCLLNATLGAAWGINDSLERNLPLSQGAAVGGAVYSLTFLISEAAFNILYNVGRKRNWKMVNVIHLACLTSLATRGLFISFATAYGLLGLHTASAMLICHAVAIVVQVVVNHKDIRLQRLLNTPTCA